MILACVSNHRGPESEDEDLLAPVHYAESSEEPDEDDPEFWSDDDGGVSDRERIIRVWVDEGRLTKVRVSSGWAAKLELREGTRLQDVVNAVLRAAHVGVAAPSSLPQDAPTVELTKEFARSLPGLTPTSLEAMRAHYARRHREFAEKLREAMETAVAPVGARVEGVTVTLDHDAAHKPFSYFAPDEGGTWADGEWRTASGSYTVHVGTSSADTALEETLDLDLPDAPSAPGEGQEGDIPIEATIPGRGDGEPGSLTLTIREFGDSVDLGEGRRTQEGYYRFDGDLPSVVVIDSRNNDQAGDTGWSVSGVANDFVNNGDSFDAGHLGWIPWTTAEDRPGVDPGPRVNPIARNGPGLAEPQTLVSATSEGRLGAATAGAHLFMLVPLDTAPGDYRSAINLTLFPVD